jgi:hypothetical protein
MADAGTHDQETVHVEGSGRIPVYNRFVNVGGIRTHYLNAGDGDPRWHEDEAYIALAVVGSEDKLREPGYHEALRRIPDSDVVVLEDAGRLLNIERADRLNALVREFLA